MDRIKPLAPGVLADYAHEPPRDRGLLLAGSREPVPAQLAGDCVEVHTPHRGLQVQPNVLGGPKTLPYMVDHLPHPYQFAPVEMTAVLPATIGHAPFAAAVGALTGLLGRSPLSTSPHFLDLGAHLSVVGTLPGGAQAVAAAFFRHDETPGQGHRVPVVMRDSLPVIGSTCGIMAPALPQGGLHGSYALLQKAYAQFLRGDTRAPHWEPHAATCAEDASTGQSVAHALYSLTGTEPAVRTLRAGAPQSARVAQRMHLMWTLQSPTAPVVLIPHSVEGGDPHATGDAPVPTLGMGDFALVPGMPLAVVGANAEGIDVFDPLRGNAPLFAQPGVEQLLHADQTHRWGHFLSQDAAQQETEALDFPQRFAQAIPKLCSLLRIPAAALQTLNYTTVSLPGEPLAVTGHRAAAVFESTAAMLSHAPTLGVSQPAEQRLRNLLKDSAWTVSGTLAEPAGTLIRHQRPLLTLTRDSTSRMFRSETCKTPRPMLDHLLDLPADPAEKEEPPARATAR